MNALITWIASAASAGADLIQIREPDLPARELYTVVTAAVYATRSSACRVVVNERADVARAAGADGVHLRASGVAVARARSLGPSGWIVGRSAHSRTELAAAADADYVIFGTVFATASKPGLDGQGTRALAAAVRSVPAPVLAIGGISMARLPEVAETGAAGVAAISLFLPEAAGGPGPVAAVRVVRQAFAATLT